MYEYSVKMTVKSYQKISNEMRDAMFSDINYFLNEYGVMAVDCELNEA